jgi:hypothetical protein
LEVNMTEEEIAERLRKLDFSWWRKGDDGHFAETEKWLIDNEIEKKVAKRGITVEELFKQDPELYRRYRAASAIKVGTRVIK